MGSNHTITCAVGGRVTPAPSGRKRKKDVKCRNGISRILMGRKRAYRFSVNRGSLLFGYPPACLTTHQGRGWAPSFLATLPSREGAAPSFLATLPSREGAG